MGCVSVPSKFLHWKEQQVGFGMMKFMKAELKWQNLCPDKGDNDDDDDEDDDDDDDSNKILK